MEVLPLIHNPFAADLFRQIVDVSQLEGRLPKEVAFALRAAISVEAHHREVPKLELICSGPIFPPFHLRRTDETILQLIQQANLSLTLVSYALYRIVPLTQALKSAVGRNVSIRLFMATQSGKVPDIVKLYGKELANTVQFYTWSPVKQPETLRERTGVLHAKAVIADSTHLLVSSANLTEYAMSLNIELGLLVRGGDLPQKSDRIFDEYIERGVFTRFFASS
ncbi:MAG: DISARM system phospholipase D-like protein DrmC [Anaerolineae bacterium]|nr:DISARM system phospholipase D-like protein DrmC [Anaerolineae bacterium]